jgi:murein DD-endopeptidase MepM/ murein hydrolase activator NlpD
MISIYKLLRKKGILSNDILEEYQDHYMTQYERLVDGGMPQKKAYTKVHQSISGLNAWKINLDYFNLHYKNKFIMLSSLALICTSFLFVFTSVEEPPTISPILSAQSNITSSYGLRMHPVSKVKKFHNGIDIKSKLGTKVVAPSSGTITAAGFDKANGYFIEIEHDEIYTTRYHHLSKIHVVLDQKVKTGDKIGEVGSTGMSTAPHLHYEVKKNGKHVDPFPFIKA